MAHYAYINRENEKNLWVVTEVVVGPDEDSETDWEAYFSTKGKGRAIRTSYNTVGGQHVRGGEPFRMNYAGIGYTYDEGRDAFIPPKPFDSWVLNEQTCLWEAPIPYPNDGLVYSWDEASGDWVEVVEPSA